MNDIRYHGWVIQGVRSNGEGYGIATDSTYIAFGSETDSLGNLSAVEVLLCKGWLFRRIEVVSVGRFLNDHWVKFDLFPFEEGDVITMTVWY